VKWNYKKGHYEGDNTHKDLNTAWTSGGGCGYREQCTTCPGGIMLMRRGWILPYGQDTRSIEEESK